MIRIITDSTSDITPKQAAEMGINVVPLTVSFGTKSYKDGTEITNDAFYQRLALSNHLPTTSQPSPEDFLPLFMSARDMGDSAIVILLSSGLSGTYQSAMIAKQICGYDDIHIVDSCSAAIGIRLLVNEAIKMAGKGMPAAEIAKTLREMAERIVLYVMVDTLEYLYKGGRLSKSARIAGGIMGVKPILTLKNGELKLIGKGRGVKQTLKLMLDMLDREKSKQPDQPYYFGYTHVESACTVLREQAKAKMHINEEIVSPVGCAIGTHVGPGAAVIAYLAK